MRFDATLMAAVALGRAFIAKLGLAFVGAIFLAGGRLAIAVRMTTFHCVNLRYRDSGASDETYRTPPQIHSLYITEEGAYRRIGITT